MAQPGDFASIVKQQADIVRIVGEYVKLRKAGAQNYSGLCPFHQEKTASFSVHAGNQFFHCFGCNAGGDVFTFVQKIENITFPESVRMVAEKLGIPMPKVTYSSPEEARQAKQRGSLLDIHECACTFFQEQLKRPEAAHAREYLNTRGLDAETIATFRIGFAPESGFLLRDAVRGQFDDDVMRESGLFSWKDKGDDEAAQQKTSLYSKFRNRVMFPICTEQGKVIAFTGRTLATDEKSGPKYLNSPETPIYSKSRVLFNLDKAKESIRKLDYAILVEGQMDCISVYSAGLHNVIASSGTAFTEPQARLLSRFSKKIVVNFDPDTAGAAAAERSLALLVSEDFEIKVLTLEAGFDPDLYIRKKGANAYMEALAQSQKYFDYLIERARTLHSVRTPEGKVKALNYLLPHIQRVPSRIVRDEMAGEISHRLGIESSVLRQELRHAATARSAARVTTPKGLSISGAEIMVIKALLSNRELGNDPISAREGQDLDFEPARQAAFVLKNEELHESLPTGQLIEKLVRAVEEGVDVVGLQLSEEERGTVAKILATYAEEVTPERLHANLLRLKKRKIEQELDEMQAEVGREKPQEDIHSRALTMAQEKLLKAKKSRVSRSLDELD